ncbi:MAG TPA: response regulator [Casimicrobiaceae bacterium]|nr:response regulator [Casimicrobiaceae bacterium]
MKKILIVEDADLNIELLTQLLEDDYALAIAKDGEHGVALASTEHPDLILMDMSLPVCDGYEATRRIRASGLAMPIIGLSAHAMAGDAERAIAAGCNDYLTKPLDDALLFEKLDRHLCR